MDKKWGVLTDTIFTQNYLGGQAWANSVDPDQMLQNAASDQGLHYLPLIQHFRTHQWPIKLIFSEFRTSMLRTTQDK